MFFCSGLTLVRATNELLRQCLSNALIGKVKPRFDSSSKVMIKPPCPCVAENKRVENWCFRGAGSGGVCSRPLWTLPRTRIIPGHGAPGGGKELFAQMQEYLTAAKKECLANDTAEGFVQRMHQHFQAWTEMFSVITSSPSCSRSRGTSGRNQPSPKDPGGIDESIDLSRDR